MSVAWVSEWGEQILCSTMREHEQNEKMSGVSFQFVFVCVRYL